MLADLIAVVAIAVKCTTFAGLAKAKRYVAVILRDG
jgi:hypothetical protein